MDFKPKTFTFNGKQLKAQIWDTAGQEKFRSMAKTFLKRALGVLIVFDLTSEDSFKHVIHWIREVKKHAAKDASTIIIGNKCDIENATFVDDERID